MVMRRVERLSIGDYAKLSGGNWWIVVNVVRFDGRIFVHAKRTGIVVFEFFPEDYVEIPK